MVKNKFSRRHNSISDGLSLNGYFLINGRFAPEKKILVALDRDGTLIYDNEDYFGKNDDWKDKVKFFDGAAEAIKMLNNFARVVVTSNQIGVARGFYGLERVKEINRFIDSNFREQGAAVDGWFFSPYVERGWAEKNGLDLSAPWVLDRIPETRKPQTGMLKLAAACFGKDLSFYKKIFVIGNSLDDLNMALNAGGTGVFFKNDKNGNLVRQVKSLESSNAGRIFIADDLISAAGVVKTKSFDY